MYRSDETKFRRGRLTGRGWIGDIYLDSGPDDHNVGERVARVDLRVLGLVTWLQRRLGRIDSVLVKGDRGLVEVGEVRLVGFTGGGYPERRAIRGLGIW